ncbi:MAG TPA: hypothetical protein VFJ29_04195, partial [Candidatus Kapabacteria bacterium]|nr:hypothetical protein [Candidatus Kapabacteria bacterium]
MRKILLLILSGCALTIFFSISFEKKDMREHRSGEEANEPNPAAAIDYFYNQRAYPHDDFSAEHYITEYRRTEEMRAQESLTATTSWRSLGP